MIPTTSAGKAVPDGGAGAASMRWRRYVAIGDSFTEGMNDADPRRDDAFVGWADRLAAHLAQRSGNGLDYANLAIRGRLLDDITQNQVPAALALHPDLVSMVGGGNDMLRPRADIDAMAEQLEHAVVRLRAGGADVLLATPTDPRDAPVIKHIRGRAATFTAHVWSIARRHDCAVIDLWGLTALQDWRMWGADRIHLTTQGHQRVASAALAALGQRPETGDWHDPLPPAPPVPRGERLKADREWAREHLRPWVGRRLQGRSSGDNRSPKRPNAVPLDLGGAETRAHDIGAPDQGR